MVSAADRLFTDSQREKAAQRPRLCPHCQLSYSPECSNDGWCVQGCEEKSRFTCEGLFFGLLFPFTWAVSLLPFPLMFFVWRLHNRPLDLSPPSFLALVSLLLSSSVPQLISIFSGLYSVHSSQLTFPTIQCSALAGISLLIETTDFFILQMQASKNRSS